ncbi:hypothetical protein [Facklamia sp. 7083-14-GEN3]|uniref:hypothetical protein n=1 Tax=Facklamia sp. 7083-14-GEN3 TaxID=2973478 RepID=UPI00215C6D44|nr:hypothetical protein [Facklamia sp. 7083-14-GEN3]MCR8969973.1 hypothetical protein [Facklamia sp. 7083-14-GEN3]
MKKILSLMIASLLLSGCQIIQYFQEPTTNEKSEQSELTAVSQDQITSQTNENVDSEDSQKDKTETNKQNNKDVNFLKEKLSASSEFPNLTFPEQVPQDINQAMESYYLNNFTNQEQQANKSKITSNDLDQILIQINSEKDLSQLNVSIDQSQFQLNEEIIFVPRIIVPFTYQEAEKIAGDNDTRLINHALTQVGNRLVLLAYYHPQTKELIPMHLVNSTHSLFFFQQ